MNNEYVKAFIYIALGLIGLCLHFGKKRWGDGTTQCTLKGYLTGDMKSTLASVTTIILAEIPLSIGQTGYGVGLTDLVGAITAGYVLDSGLNRAPDKLMVESERVMEAIADGIDPSAAVYPEK